MNENSLQRINLLTIKFVTGAISPEEQAELDQWVNANPTNRKRFEERVNLKSTWESQELYEEGIVLAQKLQPPIHHSHPTRGVIRTMAPSRWKWIISSAAVVLAAVGVFYFNYDKNIQHSPPSANTVPVPVLPPGGNRAVLVLADGKRVTLDSARNGTIAVQGGSEVTKTAEGNLTYQPGQNGAGLEGYNTIETPLGGQYRVVLPDQTVVVLNAGSSLRFPTSFSGKYRSVQMTGEAYYEVASDPFHPFVVNSKNLTVKVLGTHFNIRTYDDDKAQKATLLQGAVEVSTPAGAKVLRPGQQATYFDGLQVASVDTADVVSWKDGYFQYSDASIVTIMQDVARWYGVNVLFEGVATNIKLSARVSRRKNAADFLAVLEASGYHFKIEGRTIRVLP